RNGENLFSVLVTEVASGTFISASYGASTSLRNGVYGTNRPSVEKRGQLKLESFLGKVTRCRNEFGGSVLLCSNASCVRAQPSEPVIPPTPEWRVIRPRVNLRRAIEAGVRVFA